MENKRNILWGINIFLILANIISWQIIFDLNRNKFLRVTFFDVGEGDAIFIETPENHQILIDGGEGNKILEKMKKAVPFWDKNLDLVILTHPEIDHLGGLLEVLSKYQVENILWTGVKKETPEFEEWQKKIKEEGAKIFLAKKGQKIFCEKCHWKIEILNPSEKLGELLPKEINDTSVVAKLELGEISFLFTGDISYKTEEKLVQEDLNLTANILKVAHHGSKNSSSRDFIKSVSPEVAVISVGKNNKYGHPHKEVMDIFQIYGIKVLRTDLKGDIKIITDGKNYAVSGI